MEEKCNNLYTFQNTKRGWLLINAPWTFKMWCLWIKQEEEWEKTRIILSRRMHRTEPCFEVQSLPLKPDIPQRLLTLQPIFGNPRGILLETKVKHVEKTASVAFPGKSICCPNIFSKEDREPSFNKGLIKFPSSPSETHPVEQASFFRLPSHFKALLADMPSYLWAFFSTSLNY